MEFAELITSPNLDHVILQDSSKNSIEGTLCITGHHLILSSRNETLPAQEIWVNILNFCYLYFIFLRSFYST